MAPDNLDLIENKAMVHLAPGRPGRRPGRAPRGPGEVEPTTLVAFIGNYWDLYWVLDDAQQQLLLRLGPSGCTTATEGPGASCGPQTYYLRGDRARARVYGRLGPARLRGDVEGDAGRRQRRVFLGLALAYSAGTPEAVKEGERAVALMADRARRLHRAPTSSTQLARIYVLAGEPDKAVDQLEALLKTAVLPHPCVAPDRPVVRSAQRLSAVR